MFDFSLPELMIVLVVALVVIGPERLPKVARTLGHLYGRAQRYINGVKADISRDMAMDEFRQLQQKVQQEAAAAASSVRLVEQALDREVQQVNRAVTESSSLPPQTTQSAIESPPAAPTEAPSVTAVKS